MCIMHRTYFIVFLLMRLMAATKPCQQPCLYFSNLTNILTVGKNFENPKPASVLSNISKTIAIDVHIARTLIFWTDVKDTSIKRAYRDGSQMMTIAKDRVGFCAGIAVEWSTDLLYWTDLTYGKIEVSRLDGSRRKVLITESLEKPHGITLDSKEGLMFWTDMGSSPKIERAYLNGEKRKAIVTSLLVQPKGIALHLVSKRIYWVDAKTSSIETADYLGQNRRKLFSHRAILPFDITISGPWLLWTDWNTRQGMHKLDRLTGKLQKYITIGSFLMGVTTYDSARQPSVVNGCQRNNGGCSYLCLLKPNGFTCACPSGMILALDEKTCRIPDSGCKQPCLYVSNRTNIISTSTSLMSHPVSVISNLSNAVAIDIHMEHGLIFWSDIEEGSLKRVFLNGSDIMTVADDIIGTCDGIAVEWTTGLLYWTDITYQKIEVSSLDGSERKVLIADNLQKPRGIALDPQYGLMFWTDWGEKPKIERSWLNGKNRQPIVMSSIEYPNGISLDHHSQKIYWTDSKSSSIETADYSGKDRKVLFLNNAIHPFEIAISGQWLYWTDWRLINGLNKIDRTTGQMHTNYRVSGQIMGLAVYDSSRQPAALNGCQRNNGGCSYLCLLKPNGFTCACPSGMILAEDQKKCRIPDFGCQQPCIYFSNGTHIISSSADLRHHPFPIIANSSSYSLDIHINRRLIFWSDTLNNTIKRSFLNGSNIITIVEDKIGLCAGIAVDWSTDLLYWSDYNNKKIEVSRLDGSRRKELIAENLVKPHGIALDPRAG